MLGRRDGRHVVQTVRQVDAHALIVVRRRVVGVDGVDVSDEANVVIATIGTMMTNGRGVDDTSADELPVPRRGLGPVGQRPMGRSALAVTRLCP